MTTAKEPALAFEEQGRQRCAPLQALHPERPTLLDIDTVARRKIERAAVAVPQSGPYTKATDLVHREATGDRSPSAIVGESDSLRAVLRQVKAVAATNATVLVFGETGTGKERIARAIHGSSHRAGGPFIAVNCAALPESLMESEIFGHERGAFSGATNRRIGRFELAHEGSIFLDEIGELALSLQPKLLRVLQEGEFERLGGTFTVRSNARVIAATNRDLRAMTRQLLFREDLYYRLNVVPIRVPPLRERREDIPVLARHFVDAIAKQLARTIEPLSSRALDRLVNYEWPGNVRELQNVLERAVIFAEGSSIELPADLDWNADSSSGDGGVANSESSAQDSLAAVSRAHILRVLEETHWVIGGPHGAALRLGMNRTTLHGRMKTLGIRRTV